MKLNVDFMPQTKINFGCINVKTKLKLLAEKNRTSTRPWINTNFETLHKTFDHKKNTDKFDYIKIEKVGSFKYNLK